ncbi:hypothetical protein [Roseovarius sp. Pro17]|uniref:hypothetical protein n=1 Tax=Roseovarius sp. Pro17 TaxID=3108175 RepID=UPI002D779D0D|nr:hypothetical protein [Roseovarius sp. Pro17]
MRHVTARVFALMLRTLVCAVALSVLAPDALRAQQDALQTVSRADLIRLLGRLHEDDVVRADLASLGFAGEKLELATQHAADMLRDPVIAGHVADRVLAIRDGGGVPIAQAQGLLWGVIDQGLGHLPLRDLRYYYLVEQAVLGAMPVPVCGRAVRSTLPPARMAEETARAAARLNVEGLRNYYRIQLRAAQLGASRGPVRMAPERAAKAEASIFAVLTRYLTTRPDGAKIMRSFANLEKASNRDACLAGRVFIEAVLTLEGRELNDALIQLSTP